MDATVVAALGAAVALALVHVFAGALRFVHAVPRSRWLSFAGGVSVAYVFVHLLPEVSEGQEVLGAAAEGIVPVVDRHAYLVALAGLAVFYGLEHAARRSRAERRARERLDATGTRVFWVSTASFAAYNALVGYLLVHRADGTALGLALFAAAIGVHFVVNDYGLREHHKGAYTRVARWLLGGAVLLGWAVGVATEVGEPAVALLLAFLAGGIVLNVLKEELPDERESRFSAFALGAAAYAAVLLTL